MSCMQKWLPVYICYYWCCYYKEKAFHDFCNSSWIHKKDKAFHVEAKVGFKMLGTTFNFFQCFSENLAFYLGLIDL